MKPKLQHKLMEKYSKIFAQKSLPPQKTAMCWGISCGDGWYNLLDRLCGYLQYLTDEREMLQVEAVQVKEKFGGLRFYVGGANDVQHEIIHFVENFSYSICEWCGQPGKVRGRNWVRTLCNSCKEKSDDGWKPWDDESNT